MILYLTTVRFSALCDGAKIVSKNRQPILRLISGLGSRVRTWCAQFRFWECILLQIVYHSRSVFVWVHGWHDLWFRSAPQLISDSERFQHDFCSKGLTNDLRRLAFGCVSFGERQVHGVNVLCGWLCTRFLCLMYRGGSHCCCYHEPSLWYHFWTYSLHEPFLRADSSEKSVLSVTHEYHVSFYRISLLSCWEFSVVSWFHRLFCRFRSERRP